MHLIALDQNNLKTFFFGNDGLTEAVLLLDNERTRATDIYRIDGDSMPTRGTRGLSADGGVMAEATDDVCVAVSRPGDGIVGCGSGDLGFGNQGT